MGLTDAEVGVHELHDGSESVEALAQRLADEVPLVDYLVRGTQLPEGLPSIIIIIIMREAPHTS